MPTRQDLATLEWVRERIEEALEVHDLFNECHDRIDAGVELSEGELALFEDARGKIRAAADAVRLWDSWQPTE